MSGGGQAEGKRRSYFAYSPWEYTIIGIDTKEGSEHEHYDAESNSYKAEEDASEIASVRFFGIIEPVIFERVKGPGGCGPNGDFLVVIDGRTRVRWARVAGEQQKKEGEDVLEIPGIPKRDVEPGYLWGMSRAANLHRPDDSPLAKARQIARAMDRYHKSESQVAMEIGINQKTVKNLLALLTLAPPVQKMIERGGPDGLGPTAAAKLAKLPHAEQVEVAKGLIASGSKPTVTRAANKVREANGEAPKETPSQRLKRMQLSKDELDVLHRIRIDMEEQDGIRDGGTEHETKLLAKIENWFVTGGAG